MVYTFPIKIINVKKEDYDNFVNANPHTSVFQTSDMAEVYRRTKGYAPSMVAAINEETSEILASLLAVTITEKKGFFKSFTSHTTIRGNPIFKSGKEGTEAAIMLMNNFNKVIDQDSLYTRVYLTDKSSELETILLKNGFVFEDWLNFLIDLNRPEEDIWRSIHKSRRKGITRAVEKIGLTIEEVTDHDQIKTFYSLLTETYKNAKLPLKDISLFEGIFDILVRKGMAKFLMAKKENVYIAGRLILTYKGTIYDWYAGSLKDYLSFYPNEFLIWHILKWGSEKGYHTFDFGGAGSPTEEYGVRTFKERFGGKLVNHGRFTNVHHPKKLLLSRKLLNIYKKFK